jgi:hypothetical protein
MDMIASPAVKTQKAPRDLARRILELIGILSAVPSDPADHCQMPIPDMASTNESSPNPKSDMFSSPRPKKT